MSESKRAKLEAPTPPTVTSILADELCARTPLVDVYVATIRDPKTISRVVPELNARLPIQELMHLKRVKGTRVLLAPTSAVDSTSVLAYLQRKGFETSLLEDEVEVVAVAACPPKLRRQYAEAHKLWPCNFHANPHLEKLATNTLFGQVELVVHARFMRMAIDVCKIAGVKEGTVVVDPSRGSIVAFGFDQSSLCPIRHSVMVAVDAVAATQKGGVWSPHEDHEKIETFLKAKYEGVQFGHDVSEEGPYLCTGYAVYTTREPCITCAMALVHSRAKRVFYGAKSARGALGSLCKIHVVPNLNHHYEAFAGLLEEECGEL